MATFDFERLHNDPPPPGDMFWYKMHGLMLYAAFAILFPMGVFGVRYARYHIRFRHWFQYHWVLQSTGAFLVTGAISIALRNFENRRNTTHACIGLGLTLVVLLQPILAIFRPDKGCDWRRCWEYSHWFIGTGGIVLGWVNIFKGLDLYFEDWPGAGSQKIMTVLFSVQVSFIGSAYLLFDKCHCEKPDHRDDELDSSVPLLNKACSPVKGTQFLAKV